MKNFKKILAVICVLALLCVGVVITVIANDAGGYTGTVEGLNEQIAQIADGGTSKADARIETAVTYLETVDPAEEGYANAVAALKAAIVAQAKYHIESSSKTDDVDKKITSVGKAATLLGYMEIDGQTANYEVVIGDMNSEIISAVTTISNGIEFIQNTTTGYWNTMDTKIAINKINGLLKKSPGVLEAAGETTLIEKLAGIEATFQEKRAANKELAESYATIEEYGYGMLFNLNFENAKGPYYGFDKMDNYKTNPYGVEIVNGNSVFTVHYQEPKDNTYPQIETPDAKFGIVCEFDFTTLSALPENGFDVSGGGQINQAGGYCDPLIFGVTGEGNFYYGDRPGKGYHEVIRENVITPGEWVHFTYVFNYSKQVFDIYFEYEYIGSPTAYTGTKDNHADADAAPIEHLHIRPNASSISGEFSMDNFQVYKGSAIRTDKKLDAMTADEKFIYYCDYILDSKKPVLSRNNAYSAVGKMLAAYYDKENEEYLTDDPAIIAAIDNYFKYDYDEAMAELRRANTEEFATLVEKFAIIERTLNSTGTRSAASSNVNDFLASVGAQIETNELYEEANAKFQALEKLLGCDRSASSFTISMQRFATAPTLVARRKHLGNATTLKFDETYPLDEAYYDSCFNITYDENGNEISRKPLTSFEQFVEEYTKYEESTVILEGYERDDISKKIVNVIELIKEYDTVEEWQANYDYVNEYILILRGFVKDNEDDEEFEPMNEDYEGLKEALEIYKVINAWFYNTLQGQHIEILDQQLAMIAATDSYIEKMGMCAFITRYLASNDIDFKNSEIQRIVTTHNTYLEELEYRKDDYTALLEQNAYYFNSIMIKLTLAETYTEIKALYDEATGYYFALDANVEGTREMMAIYDEFAEKLEAIKEYSKKFVDSVALYALVDENDKDAKFGALVTCYYYSQQAELSYEGVAEKMAEFNEAYDAYIAEVEETNSELSCATGIMASTRANTGTATVVSVILGELVEN